jgi:hypothetical protein
MRLRLPQIKIKVIFRWKSVFLKSLLWGLFLGVIVSKVYWVGYQEIRWLQVYSVPYGWYETPTPNLLDLFLVLLAGIAFGALMPSVNSLFYGFIIGLLFGFIVSCVFVLYYMWAVLRIESLFNLVNFNWEWAVFFAVLNVGKIIFPQMIFLSLLGVAVGCIMRDYF